MITKIDEGINIGVTALVGKINEIIDQLNTEAVAKDKLIATLQEEMVAVKADVKILDVSPVVEKPIVEEPIP